MERLAAVMIVVMGCTADPTIAGEATRADGVDIDSTAIGVPEATTGDPCAGFAGELWVAPEPLEPGCIKVGDVWPGREGLELFGDGVYPAVWVRSPVAIYEGTHPGSGAAVRIVATLLDEDSMQLHVTAQGAPCAEVDDYVILERGGL